MEHVFSDGTLSIRLPQIINAENKEKVEKEIMPLIEEYHPGTLVLDAADMTYLSSMGLRMILLIKKKYPNTSIIHVSDEIYEIMEVTGFTNLIDIQKKLPILDVTGCSLIGKGENGCVYRLSEEEVVKVYARKNSLADARREQEMARFAFISGIPTPISFHMVAVGGSIGTVFEMLRARSVAEILRDEPDRREQILDQYAELLKNIHSLEANPGLLHGGFTLPDKKEELIAYIKDIAPSVGPEKASRLEEILRAELRPIHTLLHGDFHPGNVMDVAGELFLIDMESLGYGDPVIDLMNIYTTFNGFQALFPQEDFYGWGSYSQYRVIWEALERRYYSGVAPEEKERQLRLIQLLMHLKLARYSLRHQVGEAALKAELAALDAQMEAY